MANTSRQRAELIAQSSWIRGISWETTAAGIGTVTIDMKGERYSYPETHIWRYAALWRSARSRGLGKAVRAVWFGARSGKRARAASHKPTNPPPQLDLMAALRASLRRNG